ncbi:MAG: hypothetical protein E2590_07795 [Chryseobacterium sp.]|nr:hypothetical protein [Chryseobacterium sp.]
MMVTRLYVLVFLLVHGLCLSQDIDSLNAVYKQYYETALRANSSNGRFVILNHSNTYGKNDYELLDVKNGKGSILGNFDKFQFLNNNLLLMRNDLLCRFTDLRTGQFTEVSGNYLIEPAQQSAQVVLFNTSLKELLLASVEGKVLWRKQDVTVYQLDTTNNNLIYISGNDLVVINLTNHRSKTYKVESGIQWISSSGQRIYAANIQSKQIKLYTVDLGSEKLTGQLIAMPEGFESTTRLTTYLEVREHEHFIFPLYLKSKLERNKDPELKITYSNKNGENKMPYYHLGIYNLNKEQWDYLPDMNDDLPVYKFLNDSGDFIVYDLADDVVEEQQNKILDLKLFLDYGNHSYVLSQKRIEEGNYLWDRDTKQFVYFNDTTWVSHNISTGKEVDLMPANTKGWASLDHSGLAKAPATIPVKIKDRSAIMISNQFDYFIVDLKTRQTKQVTMGEEAKLKYQLQLSKENYPKSSWNIRMGEIDLSKDLIFKTFNKLTYDSGVARVTYKNNKTTFYRQGHYREIIPYDNGFFLTSNFALEPFKLTTFEKGKYHTVYESLKKEKKDFEGARCEIFQYKTDFGTSNAALLLPINYDPNKKYPMIVNIYEELSHDVLFFLQPYVNIMIGFNYMHYLMNGYIVLLPDLQYELANIKNSVIMSLEKSIDSAKSLASIDEKNIGVIGLSYGGYETGLALTNSNYFKTGVAGVMVSDLVSNALSQSEFITKPNYMRVENQQMRMNNNVLDHWNLYLENSPIYHVKNIEVPVLLWTGLKDKNVSPAQARMFFQGIKRQKKKAVLLEYINESHNVFKPLNQVDLNIKIWQWFDYYLKNKKPADWIRPLVQ